VIPPRIYTHIDSTWHVAIDTLCAGAIGGLVEMVFWAIVGLWRMAVGANPIARCFKFKTVGFVAIAASHAALMHFALNK
jgi:hypothetical protein